MSESKNDFERLKAYPVEIESESNRKIKEIEEELEKSRFEFGVEIEKVEIENHKIKNDVIEKETQLTKLKESLLSVEMEKLGLKVAHNDDLDKKVRLIQSLYYSLCTVTKF